MTSQLQNQHLAGRQKDKGLWVTNMNQAYQSMGNWPTYLLPHSLWIAPQWSLTTILSKLWTEVGENKNKNKTMFRQLSSGAKGTHAPHPQLEPTDTPKSKGVCAIMQVREPLASGFWHRYKWPSTLTASEAPINSKRTGGGHKASTHLIFWSL